MVVLDASVVVSATFRRPGPPALAVGRAVRFEGVAFSDEVVGEWLDVLFRPRLARVIVPELRSALLNQLLGSGVRFEPTDRVSDCRDAKDNKYLELALASRASTIVSGDGDLLVLDPWRGVRVLSPAAYLAQVGGGE